jgi:hypothetical protein
MYKSIFLSHNSNDKNFVRRLANDLRANGIKAWVDEAEILIGDSLLDKIQMGISEMDYLGVILSENSVNSEWVRKEIEMAMTLEIEGRKVKVLPFLLSEDIEIPLFLRSRLYADFSKNDRYVESLQSILLRLGVEKPVVTSTQLKSSAKFEVLKTDVYMSMNDSKGEDVDFRKVEKIRLLEEGVIDIPEEAGADGTVQEFYVTNGEVVSIKKEEGLYRVITNIVCSELGEVVERAFGWKAINGFTADEEYMLFKHDYPTPTLNINITFPDDRPPKSTQGLIRVGNIDNKYHVQPVIHQDSKANISWLIQAPSDKDKFRIEWKW